MIYIGIDPGKNGGIAYMVDGPRFFVHTLPYSDDKLLTELNSFSLYDYKQKVVCFLENVHAMPKQGVSSTFNFGKNFGFIQGVLRAYNIPYELVTPQKWKKEFSCTSDKNTSIEVCKRLFPSVNLKATERCRKDHDGMAEALLIAEYGRRHYGRS